MRKTTHCIIILVAVDPDGRPTPVPAGCPVTGDDRALHEYAQKLMAMRKGIEEEMSRHASSNESKGAPE